ncbi:hypothetical protein HOLleu_44653 [Holothuria leucospilota]|uniref:Uncharacterized protein n=1 Tax=Holothuria leucospilota TaxID=206669 RepID=A0A9Q1BAR6_HOLLE|nr:hypothetical protein HOLleu_44653 [Holothuria leucospilota]
MLAEYPPDYAGTCVQVQLQSPSVSKWPPADGFLFGEDIDLPYETEYNSALYYESFQDGSFDEEEEDDNDEDFNSFFPPASSVNFSSVSSESSESEFEIPDQGAPPEDICGSAGSDYLRNTYISSLPELSLDEPMSLSTLLPVDCPPPSPPANLTVMKEEAVSIDCVEEVVPSESPRGERKRKLKDVNWYELMGIFYSLMKVKGTYVMV